MEPPDLAGYDFSENLLTASSPATAKRGRPPEISDKELLRTHRELVFLLEEHWASVGWQLQCAESVAAICKAFSAIQGISCRSLEYFCVPALRRANVKELRHNRKIREALSKELCDAHLLRREHEETLLAAETAVQRASGSGNPERLLSITLEARVNFNKMDATLRDHEACCTTLLDRIRSRESSFAQFEVLNFIQSDRYASSPMSFANAMAGLPFISWRQSFTRCLRLESQTPLRLTYQMFLVVESVFKHPLTDARQAVANMSKRLSSAPPNEVEAVHSLRDNWYYLRGAIEAIIGKRNIVMEATPYLVFAAYQNRARTRTAEDVLLAAREALKPSLAAGESHRILGNPAVK